MPIDNQCVSGVKNIQSPTTFTPQPRRFSAKGMQFTSIFFSNWVVRLCYYKNALLEQNTFIPVSLLSFSPPF